MSYADYAFYKDKYFGSVVPESDFARFCDRASGFIDVMTFDRLLDGLPSDERAATKVQKAVCAICDKLYQLELADKQALSAADGGTSSGGFGGASFGVVTSRSAGSESISYASPSEMANGAKAWSAVYQAAGNDEAINKILYSAAELYLTGVRNDKGVPLLYAGCDC